MNSRWNRAPLAAHGAALAAALLFSACTGGGQSGGRRSPEAEAAAQAEAEQLGREAADIIDRVMAYKSSHRDKLPSSLREAGIDSLVSQYVRRLGRDGSDPLITIAFRTTQGRELRACSGTNAVLEDKLLRAGVFDVDCLRLDGTRQIFTIPVPPPPKPK